MELQFYSLYEQIDEHHYEEIYYTIGTPKKPFEEIKQEAYEEFLVRSTDGEDTSEWEIMQEKLAKHGYQQVITKDTAYMHNGYYDSQWIRSRLKPTPLRRRDGSFVFEESEFLQEVNKARAKYGKNPITLEEIAEWEEASEAAYEAVDIFGVKIETQEEIKEEIKEEINEKVIEEDFSMDDFNQFLNP